MSRRPNAKPNENEKDAVVSQWQIEGVIKGIAEADRRAFASDEDVKRTVKYWTRTCR